MIPGIHTFKYIYEIYYLDQNEPYSKTVYDELSCLSFELLEKKKRTNYLSLFSQLTCLLELQWDNRFIP